MSTSRSTSKFFKIFKVKTKKFHKTNNQSRKDTIMTASRTNSNIFKTLSALVIMFFAANTFAQWNSQTSGTTNQLNAISFYDANNGICVGDQVILKTPNGGNTWGVTSVTTNLKSVHYVSSTTAFCTGQDKIYKWDGSTWTQPGGTLGAAVESYVIYFPSSLTGYILAENLGSGKLFKTVNGGNNWALQYSFTGIFYGMKFLDASTGFVCGNNGRIQKTVDGGATFTSVQNVGSGPVFRSIDIVGGRGFAVGDDGLRYFTTNTGDTWTNINSGSTFNQYKCAAIWTNGTSIVWSAVGTTTPFRMIHSLNNDGSNWLGSWALQGPVGLNGTFNGICNGQSDRTLYTCGTAGVIYKTTNTGGSFVGVQNTNETAETYSLGQNYPNPFNPSTMINFSIPNSGNVKLVVYDLTGKEAATIVNANYNAGTYNVNFDASSLSSGIYIYKLTAGDYISTKKMTLVK